MRCRSNSAHLQFTNRQTNFSASFYRNCTALRKHERLSRSHCREHQVAGPSYKLSLWLTRRSLPRSNYPSLWHLLDEARQWTIAINHLPQAFVRHDDVGFARTRRTNLRRVEDEVQTVRGDYPLRIIAYYVVNMQTDCLVRHRLFVRVVSFQIPHAVVRQQLLVV